MSQGPDPNLRLSDFDYDLPSELVAQTPLSDRAASRLLHLPLSGEPLAHRTIRDLVSLLRPGDLLVANNSRVLPARLRGHRAGSGGAVELLLLARQEDGTWVALARPSRKLKPGSAVMITPRNPEGEAVPVTIIEQREEGQVVVDLGPEVEANLDRFGEMPLPPYIRERLEEGDRYQTVYARHLGSAAAPTAGLHLTPELLRELKAHGVGWAEVTLHVGLDTFRPVQVEHVAEHTMHSEWYEVPEETVAAIRATRESGGRVVAVGTTSARTLESIGPAIRRGEHGPFAGPTTIFITPGYTWSVVDGLLTNFHLPKSTLLMMVSALAGQDLIKAAYAEAIRERYRFFSFGDAMLML